MLTDEQKKALLKLARDSIEAEFSKRLLDLPSDPIYTQRRGVFVSLHNKEGLRGCIGYPHPSYNLNQAILRAAKSAAFDDPRFDPLSEDELKKVKIEISVLTIPEAISVTDPKEYEDHIKIGEDGLMVKSGFESGLLLPQVFREYNCSAEQALNMTCQKAGLQKEAWHDLSIKVYKFQADVFSE